MNDNMLSITVVVVKEFFNDFILLKSNYFE
jgi:hypothetical protein